MFDMKQRWSYCKICHSFPHHEYLSRTLSPRRRVYQWPSHRASTTVVASSLHRLNIHRRPSIVVASLSVTRMMMSIRENVNTPDQSGSLFTTFSLSSPGTRGLVATIINHSPLRGDLEHDDSDINITSQGIQIPDIAINHPTPSAQNHSSDIRIPLHTGDEFLV